MALILQNFQLFWVGGGEIFVQRSSNVEVLIFLLFFKAKVTLKLCFLSKSQLANLPSGVLHIGLARFIYNHFEAWSSLNNIWEFIPQLTENVLRLHYKHQVINPLAPELFFF